MISCFDKFGTYSLYAMSAGSATEGKDWKDKSWEERKIGARIGGISTEFHFRKVIELYKNGDNRKKISKNKDPREVDVSSMLMTMDCGNELMLQQIEQHGEEAVRDAILLTDFF
jgi:hypothetical protein